MLSPKKTKYRKRQRRTSKTLMGKALSGNMVSYGEYGLMSLSNYYITARQIESARMTIARHVRRAGKTWIRIFPDIPVTKKAAETRMGSGKGSVDHWVCAVRRGHILFEMSGIPEELAKSAMELASYKLPIHTRFVKRVL